MRFQPKSEETLNQEREERLKLLKKGRGQFTVLNGETKTKGDLEYMLLTLSVWDADGHQKTVNNVCLHPNMGHMIRHFCYAVGLGERYEQGALELDDCMNKSGECEIDIEKGEPDGKGGRYPDKNRVKDFVVADKVRQTTNYQTSKSAQVAGGSGPGGQNKSPSAGGQPQEPGPTELAKRRAWTKFKEKTTGMELPAQQAAFKDHVTDYFGAKPIESISPNQWDKFIADNFIKPAVTSPVGDEPVFKDEDIPF